MTKPTLESIQELFHLDVPYSNFPTWEETVEFVVNGVVVKAVARHEFRRITVKVIEPFEVTSTFEPPLFALGISMQSRRASLQKHGITETEDAIRTAKFLYIRQVAHLLIKSRIDATQEEHMKEFAAQLEALLWLSETVQTRIATEKSELRSQLKTNQITQREYQTELKSLELQGRNASSPYRQLKVQFDSELLGIQQSMINEILDVEYQSSWPSHSPI